MLAHAFLPVVADPSGQVGNRVERALKTPVRSAKTVKGLRRNLSDGQPPLLVCDVSMPGLVELVETSHARFPEMNVLFLSSKPTEDHIGSLLKPGLIDVLRTPFTDPELKIRLDCLSVMQPTISFWPSVPGTEAPEDLHDPKTGRIDAKKIAEAFGMSLRALAAALKRKPQSISKTPAAESLQEDLSHYRRSYEILRSLLGNATAVRVWLNSPQPDLAGQRPISLIEQGEAESVRSFLEILYAGGPK